MATIDALDFGTHASIETFALTFGLEAVVNINGGIEPKTAEIKRYLIENTEITGPNGASLVYEIIEHVLAARLAPRPYRYDEVDPEKVLPVLVRSLEKDGYRIDGFSLRAILSPDIDLPAIENELVGYLRSHGFLVAKGHLDQAFSAHARGEWAAANAQLRAFTEALLEAMASKVKGSVVVGGNLAIQTLARCSPPIFDPRLNEWDGQGRGFAEAFWKRLHPQGAHPGLSDQDDSTFRLRLVLLNAGHYLRLFNNQYP